MNVIFAILILSLMTINILILNKMRRIQKEMGLKTTKDEAIESFKVVRDKMQNLEIRVNYINAKLNKTKHL
jgi:hypothetical protein